MPGEAVWFDICPACGGTKQLQTKDRKEQVIHIMTPCEVCQGKGTIIVRELAKNFWKKRGK